MAESTLPIWMNPAVFESNRLGMTASLTRYPDQESALSGVESERYLSLNGSWKFRYLSSILDWEDHLAEADPVDSDWDKIEVPGVWQLQGYGKPSYRNMG